MVALRRKAPVVAISIDAAMIGRGPPAPIGRPASMVEAEERECAAAGASRIADPVPAHPANRIRSTATHESNP